MVLKMKKKHLVKARMVITTNYDSFIEDSYQRVNASVQVHIGTRGLFEKITVNCTRYMVLLVMSILLL